MIGYIIYNIINNLDWDEFLLVFYAPDAWLAEVPFRTLALIRELSLSMYGVRTSKGVIQKYN